MQQTLANLAPAAWQYKLARTWNPAVIRSTTDALTSAPAGVGSGAGADADFDTGATSEDASGAGAAASWPSAAEDTAASVAGMAAALSEAGATCGFGGASGRGMPFCSNSNSAASDRSQLCASSAFCDTVLLNPSDISRCSAIFLSAALTAALPCIFGAAGAVGLSSSDGTACGSAGDATSCDTATPSLLGCCGGI